MVNNMIKTRMAAMMLATLVSSAAAAQDAKTVVNDASRAMGADNLKTIEYSGSGSDFALGQAYTPAAPWPRFIVKSYARAIDFQTPASRVDRVRMQGEMPPRGGGQ